MDVTKNNFKQVLPTILADISESDFIAIDGEFTGLYATSYGYDAPFDTPQERYSKIKQECSDFLFIQFGLSIFKADVEKKQYHANPYNFYIFPTPSSKRARDKRYMSQASSMEYLRRHSFDFNKLYREGIPYLSLEEERRLRLEFSKKNENARQEASSSNALTSSDQMTLDDLVGFTKVITAITSSRKLIVGHCMLLDVFHILNNFHGAVPQSLEDFKTVTKRVLGRVIDTKLMANTMPIQELIPDSGLGNLYQTLQSAPFVPVTIDLAEGFERYNGEEGVLHEAGYDSLITGCCFATMLNYLGKLKDPTMEFHLSSSPVAEWFVNKLFLREINDIQFMNLDGPELAVDRQHILHVTFPKGWKRSNLKTLFQTYGKVQVSMLSKTTAYIALQNKETSAVALKVLSEHADSFQITSYAAHQLNKSTSLVSSIIPAALSESLTPSTSAALTESLTPSTSAALTESLTPSTSAALTESLTPSTSAALTESLTPSTSAALTESLTPSTSAALTESLTPSTSAALTESLTPSTSAALTESLTPSTTAALTESLTPSTSAALTESLTPSTSAALSESLTPSTSAALTESLTPSTSAAFPYPSFSGKRKFEDIEDDIVSWIAKRHSTDELISEEDETSDDSVQDDKGDS